MNQAIIEKIKDKAVDIDYFVNIVIEKETLRNEIVNELLTNQDIMVYYHCFYIVSKASEKMPHLFYAYWHDFTSLLYHKNSYHRDFGLTLIANVISVDVNHYFNEIKDDYLSHFNDEKFMTAQCFVGNIGKIIQYRWDLMNEITFLLLSIDSKTSYPLKQKELLKSDILDVFYTIYNDSHMKEEIRNFIKEAENSISPKTKKKAKKFIGELYEKN